jgi:hypothetical protein
VKLRSGLSTIGLTTAFTAAVLILRFGYPPKIY